MAMSNIPEVKCGILSVSRDCFIISLSENRRKAIVEAYKKYGDLYEVQKTVENETDMLAAVQEAKDAGCNALVVFLGNFGPETPETLVAKYFDGPVMYVAAAEETGKNLINGRGDAFCGMLNCSYNLGLRHLKGFIPAYPVGTAAELADMIAEFQPVARTLLGLQNLKIITFGPRPQDFFACNAPIAPLYDLGVEVEENSELDLLVSYRAHKDDPRIQDVAADMAKELGKEGNPYPDLLPRMAQYELTLLDWMEAHKGARQYVAFANKCWPAFPSEFGFEPCYVNSRLVSRGIPVACEGLKNASRITVPSRSATSAKRSSTSCASSASRTSPTTSRKASATRPRIRLHDFDSLFFFPPMLYIDAPAPLGAGFFCRYCLTPLRWNFYAHTKTEHPCSRCSVFCPIHPRGIAHFNASPSVAAGRSSMPCVSFFICS